MLFFLFLRLLCCQSKATVAIIHMYMYNNLLFWNYHGLAVMHMLHVQTKLKLLITARIDICLKKKLFAKKYFCFLEYWQFWQ